MRASKTENSMNETKNQYYTYKRNVYFIIWRNDVYKTLKPL